MAEEQYEWDAFISYSTNQTEWVMKHLIGPLKGCRTADGRIPKLFFDRDSIELATGWMEKITDSLLGSRTAILVISADYFDRQFCKYEAIQAFQRDPVGERQRTLPLLMSPEIALPKAFRLIQGLRTFEERWFDSLIKTLDWRQIGRTHKLRLQTRIAEATAGETLPEIRVLIECDGALVDEDETVTLISEKNTLQGTTSVRSSGGVATFTDLFLETPVDGTRIVATSEGCTAIFSEPFPVRPPRAIAATAAPQKQSLIPSRGEPMFLDDAGTLAVIGADTARLYDAEGKPRGELSLPPRIRFKRPFDNGLLVCGWGAEIDWLGIDGRRRSWTLPPANGFRIPGDLTHCGDDLLLGLWSGEIYRLGDDDSPQPELTHAGGVQALASSDGLLFVAGLDGFLTVYRERTAVQREQLEPTLRVLKAFAGAVVAVGETNVYSYSTTTRRLLSVPMGTFSAARNGVDCIVAVAKEGKGVFIGRDLKPRVVFHAWPNAVPLSLDARGDYCVFRNPDQSCSLLHKGRMVFHHATGNLSVSRSGMWVAVEEEQGIKIMPASSLVPVAGAANA